MDQIDKASDEYRKKMQRRILTLIKEGLEDQSIDVRRAQELSRYVLSCFDKGDPKPKVYQAIKNFDITHFPELLEISLFAIKEQIQEETIQFADKVGDLVKDKQLEEANNLLSQFRDLTHKYSS